MAFRAGDRNTLASLYSLYLKDVQNILRFGFRFQSKGNTVHFRGFQEPFLLQEATQDSFLHAFREEARQRYDASQPYKPYLMTIVRNHLIDRFRKQQKHARYFVTISQLAGQDESSQEALDRVDQRSQTSPETLAMRQQLQQTIKTFMEDLDDQDRDVVQLHLMGEYTQEQIATHLGESRNDVRKRLRQIRERMLRTLKREGFISQVDASTLAQDLLKHLIVLLP